MKLLYGTTNKSKIEFMQKRVEHLGIEILSLADVTAPKLKIEEDGNSPLDNAGIKALAYYGALKMPLFSCDSGLYIDGLDDEKQPGINVRGLGDYMNDDETIAYYSALARKMGGKMVARYRNAICLILGDGQIYEYMGDDIASQPFYIVSTPHEKRNEGFPLDSLSVHIDSGQYYFDRDYSEKYAEINNGFALFFQRTLGIGCKSNDNIKDNLRKYYNQEAESRDSSTKADWKVKIRRDFCDLIKGNGKNTLLELGAGAGYDSRYFMDCGLDVVAVDLSHEMVKICREKNIEAYELDFYRLSSLDRKFDCIWAMNTLLHVPKADLPVVLNEIKSVMVEDGLFYMGVYGGEDTESEYVKPEVSDSPRFFSYHSEKNLISTLEKHFRIISFEQFEIKRGIETHTFQSVVMKNVL